MGDPMILVGTDEGLYAAGAEVARLPDARIDHVVEADGVVWVLTDGRTLGRSLPLGVPTPIAGLSGERANCVLVAGDRVLIGASGAALFELYKGELRRSRSFDDTPGRASWYTPWGGPPDVRSIAQGIEGTIYVNVHVGGVVRSDDGGATWIDTMDIDADVHQVVADPDQPSHAYVAAAIGLGETGDGGETWRFTTDGLHGSYCRAVAVSARTVFVSASLGSRGRRAALYRRPRNGEGPLTRCTDGLPDWFSTNLDTHCLAASAGVVVAGDAAGTVYVSRDDGLTWDTVMTDLPAVRCLAIV